MNKKLPQIVIFAIALAHINPVMAASKPSSENVEIGASANRVAQLSNILSTVRQSDREGYLLAQRNRQRQQNPEAISQAATEKQRQEAKRRREAEAALFLFGLFMGGSAAGGYSGNSSQQQTIISGEEPPVTTYNTGIAKPDVRGRLTQGETRYFKVRLQPEKYPRHLISINGKGKPSFSLYTRNGSRMATTDDSLEFSMARSDEFYISTSCPVLECYFQITFFNANPHTGEYQFLNTPYEELSRLPSLQ